MSTENSVPNNEVPENKSEAKAKFENNKKRQIFEKMPESMGDRADWIGIAPCHASSPDADPDAWKPIDQDDIPHSRKWAMALDDAQYSANSHDYPYARVNSSGNFKLAFKHTTLAGEVKSIGIAPRSGELNRLQGSTKVTGKQFISVVRKGRGSDGVEVMFPLPHTGVWVAVKPAKDLRWLSFDTERGERRMSVGRDTSGLSLSARSGYEQQDILDFVIEHITDINVHGYTGDVLLQTMDSLDIPILIWGFLAAQYVKGHPVRIPCLADPSKCNNVQDVLMRISNMCWLDYDKFTPEQLEFVSDYRKQRTPDEIKEYRKTLSGLSSDVITLSDGTRITLDIPTAAESLFVGRRWVEEVTSQLDQALARSGRGNSISEDRRLTYLMRGMEETQLREYLPWIKKVEYVISDEVGGEITGWSDEIADLENWCAEVSSDATITKELYEAVKKFMSERTIAVVGYPAVKCPKCQGGYEIGDEHYMSSDVETIVPIDMIKCFLVLMARRLENTRMLHPLNHTGR